jgi:hypothetical protein
MPMFRWGRPPRSRRRLTFRRPIPFEIEQLKKFLRVGTPHDVQHLRRHPVVIKPFGFVECRAPSATRELDIAVKPIDQV